MKNTTLLALALCSATPAWAINKCTIDGQVVFQDAACPGKGETLVVRPASGASRAAAPAPADADSRPPSEAQRLEANIAASQKERRLRDLTAREVPGAEHAIRAHLQACQEEQAQLELAKGRYVQNLYGKTDAAQRASEQAAAAARCDTKDRELRERHARLVGECRQLGGCL